MQIIVKKPTPAEHDQMLTRPTWECSVSTFNWHYDAQETCLLVAGQVTVTHEGGSVSFGTGDYVVFPQGLSCVWDVSEPVKKHYVFE